MQMLLATTNPGKRREILELLAGLEIDLRTLDEYPAIEPPEETGSTFADNARLKAGYYAGRTGLLTVAEDSGLEIDALGGAPGVRSARFGGADCTYAERFERIFEALAGVSDYDRTARFVCSLAVASDPGGVIFEADGTIEGRITSKPQGEGGFGYDPIFFYPPFGCTLAQAGARKCSVSHRGRAFQQLGDWLKVQPR